MTEHQAEKAEMNIREILTHYVDHDGLGWPAMFAYLRTYDARKIADLTVSVARDGFKEPIYLGAGVVLDGLHRLAVAEALDWRMVPVVHADPADLADMGYLPGQDGAS